MPVTCDRCNAYGLNFYSVNNIFPEDYIEGKSSSEIWIVGLNPKGEMHSESNQEERVKEDFEKFRPDNSNKNHSYFHDFQKVSEKLYKNFQHPDESNVAHTDLVKCFSKSFPPVIEKEGIQSIVDTGVIIRNCNVHLINQIKRHKPKLIICNGSPVNWEILKAFNPKNTNESWEQLTSYETSIILDNGTEHKFWVVLSGFIGRIDNRNKRRLGKEIEEIIQRLNIKL